MNFKEIEYSSLEMKATYFFENLIITYNATRYTVQMNPLLRDLYLHSVP